MPWPVREPGRAALPGPGHTAPASPPRPDRRHRSSCPGGFLTGRPALFFVPSESVRSTAAAQGFSRGASITAVTLSRKATAPTDLVSLLALFCPQKAPHRPSLVPWTQQEHRGFCAPRSFCPEPSSPHLSAGFLLSSHQVTDLSSPSPSIVSSEHLPSQHLSISFLKNLKVYKLLAFSRCLLNECLWSKKMNLMCRDM